MSNLREWRIIWAAAILLSAAGLAAGQERKVRLQGEVVDADTGSRIPCRLYVEGPPGTFHLVRSVDGSNPAVHYEKKRADSVEIHSSIPAQPFVVELSPGEYTVLAERGKEYFTARETVRLEIEPVDLKLRLRRWIDMAARGWYSGDTHVHRSLDELPTVVMGEDLNVTFPLVYWVTRAFDPPSRGDKSEKTEIPTGEIQVDPTHVIWPRNTEYEIFTVGEQRHTLGAFFVLGHDNVFEAGVPPVVPIARQVRQQGALIELDKHAWPWSMALVPLMDIDLYELANNHMWRTRFGFAEWGEPAASYMNIERTEAGWTEWGWIDYGFQNYYALLNCGFRLRPTAGTASGVHPVPLGFGRVYVNVDGPLTAKSWLNALNEGHSFVTTGPMLFVEVDGRQGGSRVKFTGRAEVKVAVDAFSAGPLDRIEVIQNGDVVQRLEPANQRTPEGAYRSRSSTKVSFDESGWVAVRAIEKTAEGRIRFAHSSPVFADIEGRPLRPRKREVDFLRDRVRTQIERSRGVLPPQAIGEYEKALAIYDEIAKNAKSVE